MDLTHLDAGQGKNQKSDLNSDTEKVSVDSKFRSVLKKLIIKPLRILLYAAFLFFTVALLLIGLDKAAEFALKKTYLSDVYSHDFTMARRDFTRPVSHYDYDFVPGVCLIHNQEKGNRFELSNNAGFRDPRPIPVNKPEDEFRIFLTGGSTAFGLGAAGSAAAITSFYYIEQRETISHVIEKILNATSPIPGKTIKVYNTAVWGYSYQHLLMRYISKLRKYSPDLVISLDGVNEIHPVAIPLDDWDYYNQGQYNAILRQIFSFDPPGLSSYLTLWLKNNTFLMTLLWQGNDIFQNLEGEIRFHKGSLLYNFHSDPEKNIIDEQQRSEMITRNMTVINKVIEDYHNALNTDSVPHIFAIQPMLYSSNKPRHEVEARVEKAKDHEIYYDMNTGQLYRYIARRMLALAQDKGIHMLNLIDYFNDTNQWVFTDWCHLTAGANYLIGKEIANQIKEHYFKQPLTEHDMVRDKDLYFVNLARSAKVIAAPKADDTSDPVNSILKQYPVEDSFSSVEVPIDSPLELVLDMGQVFEISRMRIFWGSESDVPGKWKVEVSQDNNSWSTWIDGSDSLIDGLSVWPAMDYYAPKPVNARFIRYSSDDNEVRNMVLRSVSVFK
ncbi:MAG: discoidin domain-containing protein [Desulfomonilaceae bacterium]